MPHMGASYDLLPFENSASNPYGLPIPGDSCGTTGREDRGYSGLGGTDQRQKVFTMPVPENLLRKFLKSRELTQSSFLKKTDCFLKIFVFGKVWIRMVRSQSRKQSFMAQQKFHFLSEVDRWLSESPLVFCLLSFQIWWPHGPHSISWAPSVRLLGPEDVNDTKCLTLFSRKFV